MKTIEEQIKVMQHFADGGAIEYSYPNSTAWRKIDCPTWDWNCYTYRIAKIDPYAELKAAALDPTKQIRCYPFAEDNSDWVDSDKGNNWIWVYKPEQYQIRDKPKPVKKVKFLAYATSCGLSWYKENHSVESHWKRVPSEDKEVEIEE